MQENNLDYQDDEISLVDLWKTIVKRKYLILGILITSILLGVLYLVFTKPLYQSQATVEIGIIGFDLDWHTNFIEDPNMLTQSLPKRYGGLSVTLNGDNILLFSATGSSPRSAQNSVRLAVNTLIQKHQALFKQVTGLRQDRLHALKVQLGALTPTSANALQRAELADQIAQTELLLTEVYARPTQVIQAPTFEPHPVKPNKQLYLTLAVILGLMLGVFAVFFAEFLAKFKTEINTSHS